MFKRLDRWMVSTAAVVLTGVAILAQQPAPPAGQPGAAGAQQPPAGRGQGRGPAPGSFQRVPTLPFPSTAQELEMSGTKYRVVPVVSGLANPWSLTFLPNGDMLVTEKPGRLRIVRKGTLEPQPIQGTPEVWAHGTGRPARSPAASALRREPVPLPDLLEAVRRRARRPRCCAASSTARR